MTKIGKKDIVVSGVRIVTPARGAERVAGSSVPVGDGGAIKFHACVGNHAVACVDVRISVVDRRRDIRA